jgi:hypothetical protein
MKSGYCENVMQDFPDDDPRPVEPPSPAADDCCRSGCDPCVFDLYTEAVERYLAQLKAWEERRKNSTGPASS